MVSGSASSSSIGSMNNSSVQEQEQERASCNNSELPLILARPDLAWLYIYGYSAVVLVGIVANVLSFVVLVHDKSRTTTRIFLLCLACADSAILLTYLANYSLRTLIEVYQIESLFALLENEAYGYAASNLVKLMQIWLILVISADRYFAIHYPLRAPKVCTLRNAKVTCGAIVAFSVLFNVPRTLRYYRQAVFEPCLQLTRFQFMSKDILDELFVTVYWDVMDPIMYYFVPLLSLMTLNILLIRAVKKANALRERMSSQTKQENSVTCTLVAIVSSFILCESPTVVLYGFELCYRVSKAEVCQMVVYKDETTVAVSSLMLLVNSSINFFLYILIGKKFRRLFLEILCGLEKRHSVPALTNDSTRTSNAHLVNHNGHGHGHHATHHSSHGNFHYQNHHSSFLVPANDLHKMHRKSADARMITTNAC